MANVEREMTSGSSRRRAGLICVHTSGTSDTLCAMKIAMLYDAAFPWVKGGGERRYFEIARRLSARHDVTLVSWQYWAGDARIMHDGVSYRSVGRAPALYGGDGRRRMTEAVLFAAKALPLLLRERYDIIDCASVPFLSMYSARLAGKRTRGRLVATWFEFWDAYWLTYLGGVRGRAARAVERRAAGLGDAHIAISATTAGRMRSAAGNGEIDVIEPGVDIDAIARAPQLSKAYDVVFAGRLNAQKNVSLLLRALAEAPGAAAATCGIIGEGPERTALERLSQDLGLASRVRFLGRIDGDDAFYSAIKAGRVFAWPSLAEGFGIAPLEAMACGLPVIAAASEFSATQALVEDGVTGIVTGADPASFAEAIGRLIGDAPVREAMSRAATARAAGASWDNVAAQVERVYERVACA